MNPAVWEVCFFQPVFRLLSVCSSDCYFSFSVFAFCVSDIDNFAIYAVRYRHFALVNFVAYLRGNSCFVLLPHFCSNYFLLPVSGFGLEFVSLDRPLQYLQYSGKEEDFLVWQERIEGFCFTKKLLNVVNRTDAGTNDKKYETSAYLILCLDSHSILMLTNDCKGDGPKAWKQLRDHFNSTETPRLLNLLEKFTTLRLEPMESMVDYLSMLVSS